MDLRKLKKLIDLVEESGIAELEVTEGEEKVRIVKRGVQAGEQFVSQPAAHAAAPSPAHPAAPAPSTPQPQEAPVLPEGHIVKAPMVGTFYRSPSPGSKSFVEVGDSVKKGQTICIIEAMKLFNEIKSDKAGRVVRVVPENGTLVKAKHPLIEVEPL